MSDVVRWSTDIVPSRERLSYWNEVLCEALFGFSLRCEDVDRFEGSLEAVELDSLTVSDSSGAARVAIRDSRWIAKAPQHVYSLMVDYTEPWTFVFEGRAVRMARGDLAVGDTRFAQEAHNPDRCHMRNIRLPVAWLSAWVPEPAQIVGRRIPAAQGWGATLSGYVAQMSPHAMSTPTLPGRVLTDQLGALLSLVFMDLSASRTTLAPHEHDMAKHLLDVLRQRCAEQGLTAADLAMTVELEEAAVHRILAAAGTTFGSQLQQARVAVARDMLTSPLFDALTTAEIGRRCGFADASYFARVTTRLLGRTPKALRRSPCEER